MQKLGTDEGYFLGRMIALSDAIFAFAITLLAADVRVPDNLPEGELIGEILTLWPRFAGFLISFVVVAILWIAHHRLFGAVKRYSPTILWLNLVFMLNVVMVPFLSDLIDEYTNQRPAVLIYASAMSVTGLLYLGMWWHAVHQGLITPDLPPEAVRYHWMQSIALPAIFIGSIPIAFLSPFIAALAWVLIPVLPLIARRLVWSPGVERKSGSSMETPSP